MRKTVHFATLCLLLVLFICAASNISLNSVNKLENGAAYRVVAKNGDIDREAEMKSKFDRCLPQASIYKQLKEKALKGKTSSSWLSSPRFKLMMTTFSTFCVVFELCDTFFEQIPAFHAFTKRFFTYRFGVLMLCISQILSHTGDLFESLGKREELLIESELEQEIESTLHQFFPSDEEAARAYDRAVTSLYSQAAQTNFQYPCCDHDENGELPKKQSQYRGVKYHNQMEAWQVDPTFLHPGNQYYPTIPF
jgi:hypothetical protein